MATSDDDKHAGTKRWILKFCGNFKPEHVDWGRASEPTEQYNCMGFAMGIVEKTGSLEWWQAPYYSAGVRMNPTHYWPDDVDPGDDIKAFRRAAESVGFVECVSPDPSPGFETVTIFYSEDGEQEFWHAAIPVTPAVWASKIAQFSDIAHPPKAFDDIALWGKGRLHMRRPATKREVPPV